MPPLLLQRLESCKHLRRIWAPGAEGLWVVRVCGIAAVAAPFKELRWDSLASPAPRVAVPLRLFSWGGGGSLLGAKTEATPESTTRWGPRFPFGFHFGGKGRARRQRWGGAALKAEDRVGNINPVYTDSLEELLLAAN